MISVWELVDSWNVFFHGPARVEPLAFFRVLLGLIVSMSAALLWPVVPRHLAADGVFPRRAFEEIYGRRRLTLLNVLPDSTASVYWVLLGLIVAGLTLSVGCWTRVSAAAVFLGLVSIHHRNPAILHSGDTVLRLMAFLMMFAPAGAAYSVDAWLSGESHFQIDPWAMRLMQIQVCVIYLKSVGWKLQGEEWRNGTAAWYPMQCEHYRRFPLPRRLLSLPCLKLATWGTLLIEFSLGTLIWVRELRPWVVAGGVLLHLMLEWVINVQLFGWTMVACLCLFLPPEQLARWLPG